MKLRDCCSDDTLAAIKAKIVIVEKDVELGKVQQAAKKERLSIIRKYHQDKGKRLQAVIQAEFKAKKVKGGITMMSSSRFEAHLSGVLNRMRSRNASEKAIEAATSRIKARRAL